LNAEELETRDSKLGTRDSELEIRNMEIGILNFESLNSKLDEIWESGILPGIRKSEFVHKITKSQKTEITKKK